MTRLNLFAALALVSGLGVFPALGQCHCGGGKGGGDMGGMGGGMRGEGMAGPGQPAMQAHHQFMAKMKAMEENLDKKVQRMNEAQGEAKVDAMAAVINQLMKEHELMRHHFARMHEQMRQWGMRPGMGRPHPGMGGSGPSAESESGEASGGE